MRLAGLVRDSQMRARVGLVALILAALGAGALAAAEDAPRLASRIWTVGVVVLGLPIVFRTVRGVFQGHLATDVVASLSIVGTVALHQPLAGLIIVLMQTGGESLERYAEGRASAAVRALEAAAPRSAHRVSGDVVEDIPASGIHIGDVLLVRPGDAIACDGTVVDGESELDTSSITGEAAPVRATAGARVLSGMTNLRGSFRMRATAAAEQSQYARIVDLVRNAHAHKAPLQRLADRYAVWFTPVTVALCGIAVGLTRDWTRALAILVVATPCPLILATPVAIIGGINRAARRFVIVRTGGALEALSEADTAVFDKTGTLTVGTPKLTRVAVARGFDRAAVLRYVGAVEQRSSHLLARVAVDAVREAELPIVDATNVVEEPGQGILGTVDGHAVRVGARSFVVAACAAAVNQSDRLEEGGATLRAYVCIDGVLAAVLEYADEIRRDLPSVLRTLASRGVRRFVLLSGDNSAIARDVAARAAIPEAHGDLLPEEKSHFIERCRAEGHRVMMIGDGINDAPALSTADVGIALAARNGGVVAEAADVVVLTDDLGRVAEVKSIADRTLRIARQSIRAGLGLSAVAMLVAAVGLLTPVAGALLQEAIDVAVILNALRTAAAPAFARTDIAGSPPASPLSMKDSSCSAAPSDGFSSSTGSPTLTSASGR